MAKFLTHDSIAEGMFNRDRCSSGTLLTAWQEHLVNTPELLTLLCRRLHDDYVATPLKFRKAWSTSQIVPWLNWNLGTLQGPDDLNRFKTINTHCIHVQERLFWFYCDCLPIFDFNKYRGCVAAQLRGLPCLHGSVQQDLPLGVCDQPDGMPHEAVAWLHLIVLFATKRCENKNDNTERRAAHCLLGFLQSTLTMSSLIYFQILCPQQIFREFQSSDLLAGSMTRRPD